MICELFVSYIICRFRLRNLLSVYVVFFLITFRTFFGGDQIKLGGGGEGSSDRHPFCCTLTVACLLSQSEGGTTIITST